MMELKQQQQQQFLPGVHSLVTGTATNAPLVVTTPASTIMMNNHPTIINTNAAPASLPMMMMNNTSATIPYTLSPSLLTNNVQYNMNNAATNPSIPTSNSSAVPSLPQQPQLVRVEIRGARKSIFDKLETLDTLNSLPYKYCLRVIVPLSVPVLPEQLTFSLLSEEEHGIDKGIEMEKLLRSKVYSDRKEHDYRMSLTVFSHGFKKKKFILLIKESSKGMVLYKSQPFSIFARRSGSASKKRGHDQVAEHGATMIVQGATMSNEEPPEKRAKIVIEQPQQQQQPIVNNNPTAAGMMMMMPNQHHNNMLH